MNHIIYHEMLSHSHNSKPSLFGVQVSAPSISPCHRKPIHVQTFLNSPWAQINSFFHFIHRHRFSPLSQLYLDYPNYCNMITLQTWWPIQNNIWLPTALKRQLSPGARRGSERKRIVTLPSHFTYLPHHLAEASPRCNVSPYDSMDMARKEFSLCIERTHTTALLHTRWLLIDICMDLPQLFCIQPLITVFSTSQSWLMMVGKQRTVESADLILGRVGKEQYKTTPTHCLQLRLLLWVPFGGFGGNQGCPEAWRFGTETAGEKFYYSNGRKVLEGSSIYGGNSSEPHLSCYSEIQIVLTLI